ncbi:membrane fusion protein, Cu(I)/Ag(I) efflux system [Nitrosomonas aestuarii]|uniref:Membrane fusion protein, Cu(I)/Ag(I) efflux system n=1 Tax=Nitrosomonas aestuarii TaxID=52441 RepID=A0A1I4BX27_9PROT|nr:efflux RND transporter periplasmic adaptor subunit [Nitrosomonas aestuarii]SFK72481.1 membrane fusion protein, Cu(I)/Ag(I) efflux system [Nitrosomonas aestuarii]
MITKLSIILILIATALASGYWWGSSQQKISPSDSPGTAQSDRKILYYRNPMGHPDISPVPKKDSMGMDYIPVYEEELLSEVSVVNISTEKVQKLGVRTETIGQRTLTRTIQAVATISVNERLLYTVAPKFEGWVQQLYVNTTGQKVKKGEALMDVYSPELIAAQHEYLIAAKGMHWVSESHPEVQARMERLSENALQRLYNWDISEIDLRTLQREGKTNQYLTLRSAASGIVIDKSAIQGKRFLPGEVLYQIADLSRVWVLADVFEQDLSMVRLGQVAKIRFDTYPDKIFSGKVTFIYPTIAPETRTAQIRIELPNNDNLLKPAMYGRVEISSTHGENKALAVPNSAILDTGTQKWVLIAIDEGRFEPRTVILGIQTDDYTEVLEGVEAGESVVTSANFLIDAESNLKAAFAGFDKRTSGSQSDINEVKVDSLEFTLHRASGSIKSIDWTNATVTIAHDPIASLEWPAMTMDFRVLDPTMLQSIKPGQQIDFGLIEESAGRYAVSRIRFADGNTVSSEYGADSHAE